MSLQRARNHLAKYGLENRILEFAESSATVLLAAERLGVEPARIAKTLSFLTHDGALLILAAGDTRIDNSKFKMQFHMKAKMIPQDRVEELTGHEIGGVCPFGVSEGVAVYLDESLKRFSTVFPAAGTAASAVELSISELERTSEALGWVDVCKPME